MNLFQKYGIREISNVLIESITPVEDEEFYTPVLYLDTLKVNTVEQAVQKVHAEGGYGNKKLIGWNFGKNITMTLEDALFTPASMSMLWGGNLQAKLSPYTSVIVKLNIANKYGRLHYSTKAYPSPSLTEEEWNIVFKAAESQDYSLTDNSDYWDFTNQAKDKTTPRFWKDLYMKDDPIIEENRTELRKRYFNRSWIHDYPDQITKATSQIIEDTTSKEFKELFETQAAMPKTISKTVISFITELKRLGTIETEYHDLECIDRTEKCIVRQKEGLTISTAEQKKNLLRYYNNDRTSSYVIYYDLKTMLPLLNLSDQGMIKGWDAKEINYTDEEGIEHGYDRDFDGEVDEDKFTIKIGTVYGKFERTVKYKTGTTDGILGRTLVINADTFPGIYRITGETYIREQKTGKNQRCQIVIHRAQVSSNNSITLAAEGDPTVFSMDIDVICPPNGIMVEFRQFDIEEDYVHGGTRIVPQKSKYTYTPSSTKPIENVGIRNDEIY